MYSIRNHPFQLISRSPAVLGILLISSLLLSACASPPRNEPTPSLPKGASPEAARAAVVDAARSALGAHYRYGGDTPEAGFDCSGLVNYSYRRAGVTGLPRTASGLEQRATPVSIGALQPGDLLFFHLSGRKTSHVAIYVDDRHFIHAPSGGKRVELVGFDHVYWGDRIKRAGRLIP
jgi:cell wall-associated NlpC family hydrolase